MPDRVPVVTVAKFVLQLDSGHKRRKMAPARLQKFVYYCQAWSLVWDRVPLFDDPIEAWTYGPVVRSLWEATQGLFEVGPDDLEGNVSALNPTAKATIQGVMQFYGPKSDEELRDLVQVEMPWRIARRGAPSTAILRDAVISVREMARYYRELSDEVAASAAG